MCIGRGDIIFLYCVIVSQKVTSTTQRRRRRLHDSEVNVILYCIAQQIGTPLLGWMKIEILPYNMNYMILIFISIIFSLNQMSHVLLDKIQPRPKKPLVAAAQTVILAWKDKNKIKKNSHVHKKSIPPWVCLWSRHIFYPVQATTSLFFSPCNRSRAEDNGSTQVTYIFAPAQGHKDTQSALSLW